MSPRGAGLRVLHLQPGHPSRDANALHPPLLRGITVTQPGCLCPSRGLSHPPPPGRVLPLPRTPSSAQRRGRKPRRFPGRGMRVCPSWSWSQLTLPTPEGSPPPPASPHFSGTSSSHGIPRHDGRRRRACLPDTPQLCRGGPGFAVGSKVGREGLRLFTQAWGAPGVGRFVPNCSPLCFPYRHGEHGVRGLGGVSLIPLFLSPPYTGMGGLSPEPGLGSGPARSVSVRLSPTRSGGGSCPFAVS